MRLLLDTHVFLWYITNNPRLPQYAFDAIRDKSNEVYLSVISVWEALVKYQTGKLLVPAPANEYLDARRAAHRIANLPLEAQAVSRLLSLPAHHRDPFDRMLVCQALHHDLTIVTDDDVRSYPASILLPT